VPALRFLTPSDMSTENKRKRLSEFLSLMGSIENEAKRAKEWIAHPTFQEANDMFNAHVASLVREITSLVIDDR
jgi:hypothetical protein